MKFDRITSDIHVSHVNILDYCPARRDYLGLLPEDDVNAMNAAIVRLWNSQIDPGMNVMVIGDIVMGKVAESLEVVREFNGNIFLVPGNHDRMMSAVCKSREKKERWTAAYNEVGIEIMDEQFTMEFDGVSAMVAHFPFDADHSEEARFMDARPKDEGQFLVHGHVHDMYATRGREFNVGMDAWNGHFLTPEYIGAYFRSIS